jgi:hypothetical protein
LHDAGWQSWPRSDVVLGKPDRPLRALQPFEHAGGLVTETLPIAFAVSFDPTAAGHVARYHLASRSAQRALDELPAFPTSAIAVKAVWYLVRREGITRMPIWDGEPPRDDGNPDVTWQRTIEVDPAGNLADFEHHAIASRDELVAARAAMHDASIAMGDYLALVALHVSTKELPDWLWVTYWWHDRPDSGPFAEGHPPGSHYLMDVATQAGPPSFNPWLEARFPDGTRSNCVTCHQRAVRDARDYLPVTQGRLAVDDPYFRGTIPTDFVWTLALEAR